MKPRTLMTVAAGILVALTALQIFAGLTVLWFYGVGVYDPGEEFLGAALFGPLITGGLAAMVWAGRDSLDP